jgi:prefoldin alpha subunit
MATTQPPTGQQTSGKPTTPRGKMLTTPPVKLADLPPQQLSAIKSQLTDDLNALSTSFTQLRAAQARFRACVRTLASPLSAPPPPAGAATSSTKEGATGDPEPRRVLVPLTASLYVPGTLLGFPLDGGGGDDAASDEGDEGGKGKGARGGDGVLVDVGTGFFVRKSRAEASKFYESRVAELDGSLRDLEGVLGSKSESLRVVEDGKIVLFVSLFGLRADAEAALRERILKDNEESSKAK